MDSQRLQTELAYDGRAFFTAYAGKLNNALASVDWSSIIKLAEAINEVHRERRRIFICGNGGSAANAIHLANDMVFGATGNEDYGLDAVALTANSAVITCLGNDLGYEHIFSVQLTAAGREGDLLIALSGSGNSLNVINAIKTAQRLKMKTVAILGFDGGACKAMVDSAVHFEISDMQVSEDLQLVTGHMIMQALSKNHTEPRLL